MRKTIFSLCALMVLLAAGCEQGGQPPAPPPAPLTSDAIGHYCGMMVVHHKGPKGQIFLASRGEPIWFTSVRDTIAFTHLPEEPKDIVAIYVNDMGRAEWDQPDDSSWIDAEGAWYVVGSSRAGGMGASELVPFGERQQAEQFVQQFGGQVMRLQQIPVDSILGS